MRPMMEGLEERKLFAATIVSSSALPTSITPSVPVAIAGKTVLPNTVFRGNLKLNSSLGGTTSVPVTIAFASTNGFSYTAVLTITNSELQGTQLISDAPPTDAFLIKQKLSNSLSAFTDSSNTVNILFDNFVRPEDASTGKFEAVARVKGSLKGQMSADGKTLSGVFNLTIRGHKTHARMGTFSATVS